MLFSITATEKKPQNLEDTNESKEILEYVRRGVIEINTMEELIQICRDTGRPVVVSIEKYTNKFDEDVEDYEIEIYNDYRE